MPRVLLPFVTMAVIVGCAFLSAMQWPGPSLAAADPASVAVPPPGSPPVEPPTASNAARSGADPGPKPTASPATGASAVTGASVVTGPAVVPDAPPLPAVEPPPAPPAPTVTEPVSIRLADEADFVAQYRGYWCVGASLQMARAIITGERDGTWRTQRRYWRAARARSPNSPYDGANPIGWTATLNDLGLGPYRLVSRPTFEAAVRTAARAMARTGKPVGLVVWAGHHAWVMTGFEASGDPRRDAGATVNAVRVMDPLYPHTSKKWGRAPAPERLIGLEKLGRQFVRRHRPDYDLGVPSGWLLILPVG